MRRIATLLLLLLLPGCSLNLSGPSASKGKVLARFDGLEITDQDVFKKVRAMPKATQKVVMEHRKELIEDMAAEHFLMKEAERQGVNKDKDVRELIQVAQKKIVIAKLIDKEVDKKLTITPEDVAQYYDFHKEEFMTPLLMRASHILVKTEEEARSVRGALDQNADFSTLAKQRSIDASAIRGGDLGVFQKGQFVPEFEEAIFPMKKGEIRGPVKTQFGYHIILLTERMEPRLRDFRSVQNIAKERLINERRSKAFRAYVDKLKGNVKVDIDDKALKDLQLSSP